MKRRVLLSGCLLVPFASAQRGGGGGPLDGWLSIGSDGVVTAYSGKCDFGQGFRTVQHQLVAEELDVPLSRVRMIICDTAVSPNQGVSSGSQGHPAQFGRNGLRQALATARAALLERAAARLGAEVAQLQVTDGVVFVRGGSARVTYAQLVGESRWELPVNPDARPKDPSTYRILGQSVPRLDIPTKATGRFRFVQQVKVPGMRHGHVVRPPAPGATLKAVDRNSIRTLPGNVTVVVRKDFAGVVADSEWEAIKAARALRITWTPAPALPEPSSLPAAMIRQPSRDSFAIDSGDTAAAIAAAPRRFSAEYLYPFQFHGSMGTSCAVANVERDSATVWSASQGVFNQRDSLSLILNLPKERIRSIHVEGAGCYGLNGADSVAYDAAVLSQGARCPVRVQYSRADEFAAGESFGPAYRIALRAGVDGAGQITAWDHEAWTFSKGSRPAPASPGNVISGALLGFPTPEVRPSREPGRPTRYSNNGNTVSSYGKGCVSGTCGGTGTVETERALVHTLPSPFFTGPLRSPARLQNTFAHESFVDEVAAALGVDALAYRLRHIRDPRLRAVLEAAAKAAGWKARPSPTRIPNQGVAHGRGIAGVLYEGNNGYGALVAEVAVDLASGGVEVTRLVASNDSGPISNPDGLKAQMEGGALQGMSRALYEEVRWTPRAILTRDWSSARVLRFGDRIPAVDCVLISRPEAPAMGAGETTITLSAAAIANAIFDATGARVRQVPFTPERVRAAIAARPAQPGR